MGWLNVLLAGLAGFALGSIWYGPLFGNLWMRLSGTRKKDIDKAKKSGRMPFAYLASLLMALVMAGVLSAIVEGMILSLAILTGILLWLGLIVPITLAPVLWEAKPAGLFALNASYYLLEILVIVTVLVVW